MAEIRHIRRRQLYAKHTLCFWCEKPLLRSETTVDHLTPQSRGGTFFYGNLVLSCGPCNNKRGASEPTEEDFRRQEELYGP